MAIEGLATGRRIALGVAALALVTALGLALRMLGVAEPTVVALLAVLGIVLAAFSFVLFANLWVAIGAMLLLIVTPIGAPILVDVPLVGPVVATAVADAPRSPLAAGWRFADARVRTDLAATSTVVRRGRRGALFYNTYTVAPVVGAGCQPGEAVAAWTLVEGREVPPEWAQRDCCLVRLLSDEKHDEAIARAAEHLGLATVPDRAVGRWVADPADARAAGWATLAIFLAVAWAAWAMLCLIAGRFPEAPPSPRRRQG